jgi:trehalose-6-phosphatase
LEEENDKGRMLVFYLGDDSTDERVFSQMEGISIVVGRRRRSAADFFLKSPAEVGKFLRQFCGAVK